MEKKINWTLNINWKVALVVIGVFATCLGVMNKQTGKVLVPAKYGNVEMVSKDIIKCSLKSDQYDDYVLYDLTGKKIE